MKRRALFAFCISFTGLALCPAADKSQANEKADPVVGRWRNPQKPKSHGNGVIVFSANGTCYSYHPGKSKVGGKWSVETEKDRARKYKIVWAGGASESELRLSAEDDKLRSGKTNKIVYERYTE